MRAKIRSFFPAAACVFIAGCGTAAYEGPPRFAVSGKVTFNGEPVHGGTISFVPENDKNRPAGGPIENGAYSVPEEKGPNAGKYRVLIYWNKPTGEQVLDAEDTGEMVPVVEQVIPARYNDSTELTVEVKSGGQNVFDFTNLTSE